jgi:DMSO reductase family type II enzyme heme b subunit
VHNGDSIYFHLSWEDPEANDGISNTDEFADAAAVLLPVNGDAPLMSMGSPQQPVNAWYWRPDLESPYTVFAEGTGSTRRSTDGSLKAAGIHRDGRWLVVLRRTLQAEGDGHVQLAAGTTSKAAFAVWQGANQERGGLKATTQEWQPLELES